jgi:hypothetical protein
MSNNSGRAKVKIVKNERDPPLFTSKQLIKFKKILKNTTQVIVRHRICLYRRTDRRTDGHGETSIPPTTSLQGGIKIHKDWLKINSQTTPFVDTYGPLVSVYLS